MTRTLKTGCLVPIRLTSERLPGKALKVICGRPVVHHLLDRINACCTITNTRDIVVCTTEDPTDDPLEKAVLAYGASIFRGDTDDIIRRFYTCVEKFGFDVILQVDGDDPVCDTEYMDLCVSTLLDHPDIDVVYNKGLPLGVASKAFRRDALKKVFEVYATTQNDTGFAYYFTKSGLFNVQTTTPRGPHHIDDKVRLTLDYEEDFEVFRTLFEALYRSDEVFGLADVVKYFAEHPEVAAINANLNEGYFERTQEKAVLSIKSADGRVRRLET